MRSSNIFNWVLSPLFLLVSTGASAAGAGGAINVYGKVVDALCLSHHMVIVLGSALVLFLNVLMGLRFRSSVEARIAQNDSKPIGKACLPALVETVMGFLYGLTKENCGHNYRRFLPFLSGIFFFILLANLTGLVPGFPPPTESMSLNLGMGLVVFVVYNIAGIQEKGIVGYLKHFMGPVLFIAPMFFCLEIISNLARPFSLALRLAGNIFGDHLLLALFSDLTYLIFPAALMFFGLLVACVQSYVFTLLTALYLNEAVSHDH